MPVHCILTAYCNSPVRIKGRGFLGKRVVIAGVIFYSSKKKKKKEQEKKKKNSYEKWKWLCKVFEKARSLACKCS